MNGVSRGLILASLSLSLACAAHAQTGDLPSAQLKALQQKLSQRLPSLPPIESARTTPLSGLIELKVGNSVFYSDATGEYLIEGHILETRTQRDLTAERLEDINRVAFNTFPFQDAIMWKNGTGKRRLVIFADPNCGYCKQLEREVQKLKDITVYTLLIPILGPDSRTKAENVWCTKDRTTAWLDWMLDNKVPTRAFGQCANPLQRNLALAQRLGVTGTPAMFFEDGTRLAAAAPLATIEQRLDRAVAKSGR
ncbi:MAG: DsbC family protein [Aquabacterium sp.]|jgi:thiol:disulfide interchange protein DsbC|uniref:DsbC family protein n=1 Tax=Aquabacterium sp. TaxID=1872578 RepID=UPI001B593029|nr:DsbC family protein [Aquabacterium sp.]MBP7131602.1 DsbC family protein [Aquabacterium sp.]MBP9062369.1 DsbC family protein [Aquabacterium sp.]MDQ5926851.1 Thiol:disulfide interchange protein [Pseudomonadota bacterium]